MGVELPGVAPAGALDAADDGTLRTGAAALIGAAVSIARAAAA